jgi:REP element-mobilizing transposase RayT
MLERKRQRLIKFNYTLPGWYFITICTFNRINFFGKINSGNVILSPEGKIATELLLRIPEFYPSALKDEFVIMPNHLHAVVVIKEDDELPVPGAHFKNHIRTLGYEEEFFFIQICAFAELPFKSNRKIQSRSYKTG